MNDLSFEKDPMVHIQSIIDNYDEMVRHNIERVNAGEVKAAPGKIIVQVVPAYFFSGRFLSTKPHGLDTMQIWVRYGTVLSVGEGAAHLKQGDHVFFSNMVGVQFWGGGNPLSTGKTFMKREADDQIRVFVSNDTHSEVFGTVEYDLIGKTVQIKRPGQSIEEVLVVEESVTFMGHVRIEGGELIPTDWLVKPEEDLSPTKGIRFTDIDKKGSRRFAPRNVPKEIEG